MSRGKKLDIFIGAEIEDGWAEIKSPRKTVIADEILEPSKHFLVFKKEKRRGKTVTLVGEFHLHVSQLETILKNLKKKLGCGGTLKDGWMEFQGELQEKLRELLINEGFRFKRG
ncbi:MAG: translation initiation factor SUI1 [Sulfurimonas sp. RIFOXYD12_FULL_33_39]|uniref:translation initiation factor n=1 Tax=unclassified Sulfurimonas TaxID=2623549 RepID=UPI0008D7048F|nr:MULTISPECIES: translation initiation factor [unclassified Sulfurimonas]OHE05870.1 MAG: translation initiation factor SUI1 [Sulfurimonas sp. RIFCSPLOWO2_12_FULL_34_6]OHE10215.1 MAG: translation initiation factor SUI1 [Sulfurimonas sp. RIFOXYD12_FULL_33_39]OHE14564.1 MAG: translation initiation factor SUI1 [Sulfurimonas sp. RIFOXYD2_FULL_34_21]DAB28329.1 MAG TPA: translation initiation factor [Sulfurimonas sp. UBA10385]